MDETNEQLEEKKQEIVDEIMEIYKETHSSRSAERLSKRREHYESCNYKYLQGTLKEKESELVSMLAAERAEAVLDILSPSKPVEYNIDLFLEEIGKIEEILKTCSKKKQSNLESRIQY